MKTTRTKNEDIQHNWHIVDADGKILGRIATQIAKVLMGKNKVTFSRDVDDGDGVIVINASKISVSGNKLSNKKYYFHTGYIGNMKDFTLEEMLNRKPEEVIKMAVKRMLPKNKLGRKMLTRLKIYKDDKHPHSAQNPSELNI